MTNRKIIVLAIMIVGLFALSAVNAADNITDNSLSTDFEINEIASSDSLKAEDAINDNNATDSQDVLAVGNDEKVGLDENSELISSPSYYNYDVNVYDTTIDYSTGGNIPINIDPYYGSDYAYDFYLYIIDSQGNYVIDKNICGYDYITQYNQAINAYQLNPGSYQIKIFNYHDNHLMSSATLTVTSTQTSYNENYLSYLIENANYGDTLILDKDISYNSDNSGITISTSLTIDGKGHTINANNYSRILLIKYDNVVLKNIIFKNAYRSTANGGAIYCSGSKCKLINCTFINNYGSSGAAVFWCGSYGEITGCKFEDNICKKDGSAVYWSSSNGKLSDSTFINNHANNGGGVYWSGSYGEINNCIFNNNVAEYGGAISINNDNVDILNSNFNNNIAEYGSAIKLYSSRNTITNSIFNGLKTNYGKYIYNPSKSNPYLYINAQDIVLGEVSNIQITYEYGITGEISISLFSPKMNKTVYNSVKTLTGQDNSINVAIPNLKCDEYLLNVEYSGDIYYNSQTSTSEFEVIGKESSISFEVQDITWGTPIVLNPKVTSGATGLIDVYVNNEYIGNFTVGSKYTLTNVGGPSSTIKLEYLGDDNYRPSKATQTVNVERLNIAVEIPDEIDSGISTFTVTLNEDATGDVSAKVRDIRCYCENSLNGTYILTSEYKIAAGSAYVEVYYGGNSKYNPQTFSKYVEVKIKTPTIHLNIPNVKTGNSVSIYPTIDNGATGRFEIYVDGSFGNSINVGNSYTLYSPSIGKHEVKVYYSGDEYYAATENATAFRVYKTDPIVAYDTQIIYKTDNYLKATFYDEYGYLLINKMVIFNVNGTDYYKLTDENGTATLDKKFGIGIYPVEITNIDVNHQKTVYLTVFTSIISQDMTVYYNSGYDFNATFLDSDATPLSNSIVLFNVSGTMYNVKTDGYGYAKLIVPLPVGTYKIVSMNTKTNEVNTNKLVVVTSINSQDMSRAYNSTMDYKATFYDVDGSYLKNQTVTFEVDSRTYPVRTDKQGVAILKVGLAEGEYNITSTNPATNQKSTNKLTILERIINNEDVIVYGNTATYYRVRVINNNAVVCGAGETVTFKLNGKTHAIKTDSTGYASLKITEPAGIYDVTATYYGYTVKNRITVLENVNSILTLTASNINYGQTETIKLSTKSDYLDGKVVINITGDNGYEKVFIQNAATSITKELTNLNASNYNVKAEYIDFGNLIYNSAVKTFKVSKINPNIILTVDSAPFGEYSNITVNVPQAEGNVTIKVGSKTYNEHIVADGVIVKRISDLRAGTYQVSVTYNGNNNFNKGSKTAQLNVTKGSVGFYIDVKDVVYGSDVNVKVSSLYNGKVTLKIGSTTKTADVAANKDSTVNFGKLNAGKYTITGNIVPGDKNYAEESDSMSFEVKKATPKLTLKAENIDIAQQTKILATISNSLTGNINLKLNGKDYAQAISDSKAVFNISNLAIGKYSITASYAGNANYNSASATASFEVRKIQNFNLATPTAVSTYDNKFDLGLPNDASGNVTLTIEGTSYTAKVANGEANIKLPQLSEGNHPYTLKYTGDSKYAGFTKTNTITVAKTTIKSRDMTVNSGSGYDYKTSIINTAGAPLANTQVHIAVNGKIFSVKTDSKGVATLNVGLGDGTYAITVINPVTGEQAKSTLTVRGGVTKTTLKTATVRTVYNGGKYITINLKDIFGKALDSAILQVSIGGKTKYISTNSKGQAKITTNGLVPATHKIKITFAGNAKYAKASVTSKVIVTKAPVKLSATKKTYKAGIKIKKYTVTLKNNKNKVLKKAVLTLKVNGRTYKAVTNSKGKATFKITKLTKNGNFKAVVKFAGNKYYKALIKKPIISVRK